MYIPLVREVPEDIDVSVAAEQITNWWPHWVDLKSPEYSQMKRHLSLKYGAMTFSISVLIIVAIPVYDYLYDRYLYNQFNKMVHRLKLSALNRNNWFVLNISIVRTIIFWTALVTYLSLRETQSDWILIAKRLGRVPTVLLPTVLFLTIRPSPLPNTLYLSLLTIHKWLSRIIVLQGSLHTIIYLFYFQHLGTWHKLTKAANVYGIIAMLAFLMIAITSLPMVRRLNYQLFYTNHYIFTWVIVISLYFHARPGIPYITTLNIAILIYQIFYKYSRSKKTKVDVINISQSLSLVLIPNSALSLKSGFPGSHIRVSKFSDNKWENMWNRFCIPLQHPYTITTLPSDNVQKLIVRNSKFQFNKGDKYYITGPFLPFLHFLHPRTKNNAKSLLFKIKCKRCLIVVGGSLISFALPIMRVLNYNGCSVKIVWVVRQIEDLKLLNYYSNTIINDDSIDIFITGDYSQESKNAFINSISEFDKKRRLKTLEQQSGLLNGEFEVNSKGETSKILISSTHASYGSTNNDLDHEISKIERRESTSTLSRKSSISEVLFGRDNDDLENVDVDLNDCNYDMDRSVNPDSKIGDPEISAGFDDSLVEDLEFSMDSSFANSNKAVDYSSMIKLNLGVDVQFGRPKLGGHYYNWCINQTCIGPVLDISNGENICCKDLPQRIQPAHTSRTNNNENSTRDLLLNYMKSNGQCIGADDSDALYLNEHFLNNKRKNRGEVNDDVWVIGAGPLGLVNNVQLWANDCGFHFHAESFSV